MRTLLAVVCVVLLSTSLGAVAVAQDKPSGTLTGRFVTVYLDIRSNGLGVLAGDEISAISPPSDPIDFMPLPDLATSIPIAAAWMTTGTPYVGWYEIYDLRFAGRPVVSGSSRSMVILDEGSQIYSDPTGSFFMNFRGDGVTASTSGAYIDVNVPGQTGSTRTLAIFDEGTQVYSSPSGTTRINFRGSGVDATVSGTFIDIYVPGAVGGDTSLTLDVRDEGSTVLSITTGTAILNFRGPGVVAGVSGTYVDIYVPGQTGSTRVLAIYDEGGLIYTSPTGTTRLNFAGAGVLASVSGTFVDVNVPGQTGSTRVIALYDEGGLIYTSPTGTTRINFSGDGITASTSGTFVDVNAPGNIALYGDGASKGAYRNLNFVAPLTTSASGSFGRIGFDVGMLSSGTPDHGTLGGLADDDHTQYVLRQPTADTVINDAGGDFNWRMEGTSQANLFSLDAGLNRIGIGISGSAALGLLHIFGGLSGAPEPFGTHHLLIESNTTNYIGFMYPATASAGMIMSIPGDDLRGWQSYSGPSASPGDAWSWATEGGAYEMIFVTGSLNFNDPVGITTTSGAITFQPGGNFGVIVDIAGTGDFIVNDIQLVVDTSEGRVGIGGAPTDGILHVISASAGAVAAAIDGLVVEGAADVGVSILTPDNAYGYLVMRSPSSGSPGHSYLAARYGVGLTMQGAGATLLSYDVAAGTFTVNSANADINFIVDAVGRDNALFVQGSDGQVGIGGVPTDGTLHVLTATAGSVAASGFYDDLVVENSDHGGISILTPAASYGGVVFGNPTSNSGGWLKWLQTTGQLLFGASASDRMSLTSSALTFHQATTIGLNTTAVLGIQGAATSEVVFNDASADVNFRVESVGNANMFFLDAGLSRIGIGTSVPASILEIEGASPILTIDAASGGQAYLNWLAGGVTKWQQGWDNYFGTSGYFIYDNVNTRYAFGINGVSGYLLLQPVAGNVGVGLLTPIAKFDSASGARTGTHPSSLAAGYFTGALISQDGFRITHSNGTQGIAFGYEGIQKIATGGANNLLIDAIAGGAVIFNEGGADIDFRVESDGNANMLFVDGGANRVGVAAVPITGTLEIVTEEQQAHQLDIYAYHTASNPFAGITMYSARGSRAIPTGTLSGDWIINFSGRGYGETGWADTTSAYFAGVATENWTDTARGSRLEFAATIPGTTTRSTLLKLSPEIITAQAILQSRASMATGINDTTGLVLGDIDGGLSPLAHIQHLDYQAASFNAEFLIYGMNAYYQEAADNWQQDVTGTYGVITEIYARKDQPQAHLVFGFTAPAAPTTIYQWIHAYGITGSNAVVINENAADMDFRVESQGNSNMIMVDAANNAVGVGGAPDANIALDVVSTTKAFRPPVMTTTERNNIPSPQNGMIIWNSTTGQLEDYNGGWAAV